MIHDEGLVTRRRPRGSPLLALVGVRDRHLAGPLGHRQALQAHREARVVHHREHVAHAGVLLTDQVADGPLATFAVAEHARRAGLDPHLVLDAHAGDVIALAQAAVIAHEELRHDEAADALGAGRSGGRASEDEVDDVLAHVVLTEADEDLGAGDAVGAVAPRHGLGAQGPDVGPGLWLGEVHGAGPLPRHHLGEVGLPQLLGGMVQEHVDGTLVEQRAHREGHVRGGEDLLHGDADQPREATSAVLRWEGHPVPTGVHVGPVRLLEPVRGGDRAVVVAHAALHVADPVQGGHEVFHEAAVLLQHAEDAVGVDVLEAGQGRHRLQVDEVLEHEADVMQGGGVLGHEGRLEDDPLRPCGRGRRRSRQRHR